MSRICSPCSTSGKRTAVTWLHPAGLCVSGPRLGSRHSSLRDISAAVQTFPSPTPSEEEPLATFDGDTVTPQRYSTENEALFNCVNILLGCGVLTIPYALEEGGWAAFGVLALLWLSTNYTGKILVSCQEYFVRHPGRLPPPGSSLALKDGLLKTYEDIAEAAFGRTGRDVMTSILYTELLGTCALFLILQKDHVRLLLDSFPAFAHVSDNALLALALAVVLPTTWLPDLAALSYLGAAGFFSAVAVTGLLVATYATSALSGGAGAATLVPAATSAVHAASLPMTFGLLAFVFAGHAVFPAIYQEMDPSERHKFPAVLDKSYLIVLAVCMVVGFTGYATFGDATMEEVTLNLPSGALSVAATMLVLVSPFAKFALTLEPVALGAEKALNITPRTPWAPVATRAVRTALAGLSLALAAKVPFFGTFMAILGSFLTLTVSVLFPCMAHLKLGWWELSDRERALNGVILGVGLFATVAGTATSVQSLFGDPGQGMPALSEMLAPDMLHLTGLLPEPVLHKLVCTSVCHMA